MNSMDSKDSMVIGQHRRSFGTPTKISMSKFIVFPSAVMEWRLRNKFIRVVAAHTISDSSAGRR